MTPYVMKKQTSKYFGHTCRHPHPYHSCKLRHGGTASASGFKRASRVIAAEVLQATAVVLRCALLQRGGP